MNINPWRVKSKRVSKSLDPFLGAEEIWHHRVLNPPVSWKTTRLGMPMFLALSLVSTGCSMMLFI